MAIVEHTARPTVVAVPSPPAAPVGRPIVTTVALGGGKSTAGSPGHGQGGGQGNSSQGGPNA